MGTYPFSEATDVPPASFPYDKVTHIAIGPAVLASDAACCSPPRDDQTGTWEAFSKDVIARGHKARRKVLLQLGGEGSNAGGNWSQATASSAATLQTTEQMVGYAKGRGYDGIEVDWQEDVDLSRVAGLGRELRTLWPSAILTVDVAGIQTEVTWAPSLAESFDRLNVMTNVSARKWGDWDGPWHQGAMYENADRTLNAGHPYSVDRIVQALFDSGVDSRKIAVGIGLFGTGYGDSTSSGSCPTSPEGWANETQPLVRDRQLSLATIERLYAPTMTRNVDSIAETPWLSAPYPGAGGDPTASAPKLCYITYEDPDSASVKVEYVKANDLGGLVLSAVPQDRRAAGNFPVLDAVNRTLRA